MQFIKLNPFIAPDSCEKNLVTLIIIDEMLINKNLNFYVHFAAISLN